MSTARDTALEAAREIRALLWAPYDDEMIAAIIRRHYAPLVEAVNAANGILWMADEYAQAGGAIGPEMRDYNAAKSKIDAVLTPATPPEPPA